MVSQKSIIEEGSLRHRLKTGTKGIHDVADKCMQAFLFEDTSGSNSIEAYKYFLLQLYVLYEALEDELEANRSHPIVGPIHFPDELNRLRFVAEDLDYYYNNNWRHLLESDVTEGMRRYVARIRHVGQTQPELLVAHSYTRYLGDMSGGQILRRLIKKRYSLPADEGVSFYGFDHVESIASFKELYTARMNSVPLDEAGMCAQVEEAKRIFQHNIDVFEEVGAKFKQNENSEETANLIATQTDNELNKITSKASLTSWQVVFKVASVMIGVSATAAIYFRR